MEAVESITRDSFVRQQFLLFFARKSRARAPHIWKCGTRKERRSGLAEPLKKVWLPAFDSNGSRGGKAATYGRETKGQRIAGCNGRGQQHERTREEKGEENARRIRVVYSRSLSAPRAHNAPLYSRTRALFRRLSLSLSFFLSTLLLSASLTANVSRMSRVSMRDAGRSLLIFEYDSSRGRYTCSSMLLAASRMNFPRLFTFQRYLYILYTVRNLLKIVTC